MIGLFFYVYYIISDYGLIVERTLASYILLMIMARSYR
jgi:hypothetical protein